MGAALCIAFTPNSWCGILLTNGDFTQLGTEFSPALGGIYQATGWINESGLDLQAAITYTGTEGTPSEGSPTTYLRLASDVSETNSNNLGFIVQDLGTMVAGQTYTFTATALGGESTNDSWGSVVELTSDGNADPATVYASQTISGIVSGAALADAMNISYTATSADNGNPLYLWLQAAATDANQNTRGGLYDIQFTVTDASAPEPATLALLAAGLLASGVFLRRASRTAVSASRN